jgi:hypothetical protein
MILQRFLEGLLAALSWLVDVLFERVVLVAVLLCLGLGTLSLLVVRTRMRGATPRVLPSSQPLP